MCGRKNVHLVGYLYGGIAHGNIPFQYLPQVSEETPPQIQNPWEIHSNDCESSMNQNNTTQTHDPDFINVLFGCDPNIIANSMTNTSELSVPAGQTVSNSY